jgi:biotin synthase
MVNPVEQQHSNTSQALLRHDWTLAEVMALYQLPFSDLMYQAQSVHRQFFEPNQVQLSTLINIKAGACPEDCAYCPQSARYHTGLKAEPLMQPDAVLAAAKRAQEQGATRFCMGAAWRSPKDRDLDQVIDMVKAVKGLGMETCVTLGMLSGDQAQRLHEAGLDYYNHNLDTSEDFYGQIISTRDYQDRLDTLEQVRRAGIKVCCGGIIGMGERQEDVCNLLIQLANLEEHPESVPINLLVRVEGTPLAERPPVAGLDLVRTIALARILMPASYLRLSAGRTDLSEECQALCFLAGANSVFVGERLLTTDNPELDADRRLFQRLGIEARA